MRHRLCWCFLFYAAFAAGGCCNPGPLGSQPVTLRGQETSMWCWAASGEMCMEFLGTSVQQCDEANKRFGHTDCCTSPTPTHCVLGGWPEFDKYGFDFQTTAWGTPLTWDQLKDQIYCKKKPFCFSWGWTGGGGHMMVAIGYTTIGGVNMVAVNNPWPPTGGVFEWITYDRFVSDWDHEHWIDYYNITKR
jgi:hypothetical protein